MFNLFVQSYYSVTETCDGEGEESVPVPTAFGINISTYRYIQRMEECGGGSTQLFYPLVSVVLQSDGRGHTVLFFVASVKAQ